MATIKKDPAYMEFPLSMARQDAFPLDKYSVFYSLSDAEDYAKNNPIAYPGQPIAVVDEAVDSVKLYKININGTISELATAESSKVEWGSI